MYCCYIMILLCSYKYNSSTEWMPLYISHSKFSKPQWNSNFFSSFIHFNQPRFVIYFLEGKGWSHVSFKYLCSSFVDLFLYSLTHKLGNDLQLNTPVVVLSLPPKTWTTPAQQQKVYVSHLLIIVFWSSCYCDLLKDETIFLFWIS